MKTSRTTRLSRTLLLTLTITLGLAQGCNLDNDDEAPGTQVLRQALPDGERMTIRLPESNALVGQQATFYAFTRNITLGVNGFVRNITNLIEDIVQLPPTNTDGESYAVWGPHTEPLSPATWRVRVDRTAEGRFEYVVEGWPKNLGDNAAIIVLEGVHEPGAEPRQGKGSWTYHLSAGHALDPIAHDSVGDVSVDYDIGDARVLEVTFDEVQGPRDPMTTSTLYRYTEAADLSGTFDFVSNLDIHADDNPEADRRELLLVRSRWLRTGPGRTDVHATHGDLPAGIEADVTECWDDAFAETYLRMAWGDHEETEGSAADCPYGDTQAPQFEGFDPDAFADGDLLAAIPRPADFDVDPAAVDDPAPTPALYYQLARNTIAGLSLHVGNVIKLIQDVTSYPPTTCAEDSCTWGPWTDWRTRVSSRVIVRRTDEGQFGIDLSGRHFDDPEGEWTPVIVGGFSEADEDGDGSGWFTFDLNANAELNPAEESRGVFRSEFTRRGSDRWLAVRVTDIVGEDGEPYDARYYVSAGDDGGVLDLQIPVNVHENEPDKAAKEVVDARVRWQPDGAGVANIRVTEGDIVEDQEFLAVECWDDTAAQTHFAYMGQALDGDGRPDIDADACVFEDWSPAELPPFGDENPLE